MLLQPTLETERLILRPLVFTDASLIQKFASNRQIADTMISIPHPYPDGEAERYISKQMAELKQGISVTFAIEPKSTQKLQGIMEIRDIDREHSVAELSYWLAVEAWRKGYMSEALQVILRFGFITLSLNRLYAYHMTRNPSSDKLLRKNGFQQEGLLRQRVRKWGVFEDVVLQAIIREDWQNQAI